MDVVGTDSGVLRFIFDRVLLGIVELLESSKIAHGLADANLD